MYLINKHIILYHNNKHKKSLIIISYLVHIQYATCETKTHKAIFPTPAAKVRATQVNAAATRTSNTPTITRTYKVRIMRQRTASNKTSVTSKAMIRTTMARYYSRSFISCSCSRTQHLERSHCRSLRYLINTGKS